MYHISCQYWHNSLLRRFSNSSTRRIAFPNKQIQITTSTVNSLRIKIAPYEGTMSQGFNWPSYISTCSDAVELSLLRCIRFDGRMSFNDLLRATDMKLAPRYVWYKLHDDLVMRSKVHNLDDLWSTKIIAWGLNIWEADLLYLYRSVVQELALRRRGTLSRVRPGELPVERAGTCNVIRGVTRAAG